MTKKLLFASLLFCSISLCKISFSQTSLAGGDIAFVGMNLDGSDEFAFMLLKSISAGTTITFTDHQWQHTGGFYVNPTYGACNSEAFMTWTSTSALPLGTIVVIANPGTGATYPSSNQATASTGTVSVPNNCPDFSFSSLGDVLYAYQGSQPTDNTATNFLAAINIFGSWLTTASTSTVEGARPTNLSISHTLLITPHIDNAVYKGSLTGTRPELLASINNQANWQFNDNTPYSFPADIGTSTLPVTWISFDVQKKNTAVVLHWKTANESQNAFFTVQSSKDGIHFQNLGIVKASEAGGNIHEYSFIDQQPSPGVIIYRLQQTDFNGKTSFSLHKKITFTTGSSFDIAINPVTNGQLKIQINNNGMLTIASAEGRIFHQQHYAAGVHTIDVSGYSKGTYFVRVGNETNKLILK